MNNTIKRTTTTVIYKLLVDTTAGKKGDLFKAIKDCYGWHTKNITTGDATEQDTPANVYFDKVLMYFEYYNCINTETGKYTAFYIEL